MRKVNLLISFFPNFLVTKGNNRAINCYRSILAVQNICYVRLRSSKRKPRRRSCVALSRSYRILMNKATSFLVPWTLITVIIITIVACIFFPINLFSYTNIYRLYSNSNYHHQCIIGIVQYCKTLSKLG